MAYTQELTFDTLRTAAFGAIGAAYAAVGTATTRPTRLIHISNGTDAGVLISFDGVNDHIFVPANGFTLYDLTANKVRDDGAFLRQGLTISARRAVGAPTSGTLYIGLIGGAT
jgi:hypothetical protein